MTDKPKIKQETWIPHEGMGGAIEEWAQEVNLQEYPKEVQDFLVSVYRDGWSGCLHHTMAPARDMAMMLLQVSEISKNQGKDQKDFKVVLGGQALEFLEELAHKIVGLPADWQLDDIVEAVQVDVDNPPDDLPDGVLEELKRVKANSAKDKDSDAGDS